MTSLPAISVRNLTKTYRGVPAVSNLGFEVASGSLCAFLGTNGAGKSTTISCITTLLDFDSGEINVLGERVGSAAGNERIRRGIGVVFQNSVLDPRLSVRENLATRARIYGLSSAQIRAKITELVELIGLAEVVDRRYGTLSGGQRRRADIARALVHDPQILFLDEPTTGLDPGSREKVWEAIHALRAARGITVLLTTHYLAETERADDVLIIRAGTLAVRGSAADLRERYSSSLLTVSCTDPAGLRAACADAGIPVQEEGARLLIHTPDSGTALDLIRAHRPTLTDFEFRHGTMDDVFLAVTGEAFSAAETTPEERVA